MQLANMIRHKPTAQDVDDWEEEALRLHHPKRWISSQWPSYNCDSEEEYQLKVDNNTIMYQEPTGPGAYNPEISGDKNTAVLKRMEVDHTQDKQDYQHYFDVTEHIK